MGKHKKYFDLGAVQLNEDGRAEVSEIKGVAGGWDILDTLETIFAITNGSCSNLICSGDSNTTRCMNKADCDSSKNPAECRNPLPCEGSINKNC